MIDTLGSKYARFFLVFPVNAYNFCVYIYIYTLVPWILRIVKTKNQQLLFERKITHQAKKKTIIKNVYVNLTSLFFQVVASPNLEQHIGC